MIQFPICPPEVFAWWVAQRFCSYVFVQYLPLVFIGTQSYGYMHLNFQFRVCNSFGFILHESHIEMGINLSSKLLASEERCAEICITNTYNFLLLESRMTRGVYCTLRLEGCWFIRRKTPHGGKGVFLNQPRNTTTLLPGVSYKWF